MSTYYAISINATGVNASAYYQLDPTPNLSILQGGFTCVPVSTDRTSVSIYPQVAQLQFPANEYISGSVTIVTDAPSIDGNFQVSPAVNVPVTLTLWGNGSQNLGEATLEPGQTSLDFKWSVGAGQGMSLQEARDAVSAAMNKQ